MKKTENAWKKTEELTRACHELGMTVPVSYVDIKKRYRALLKKWHPDKCKRKPAYCKKKTMKIIAAYEVLVDYIENYQFSFIENDPGSHMTAREFWQRRFADDPMWGQNI